MHKTHQVLVVEDNDTMRLLLVATLAADGYAVTEATDGISALVAAENNPPDLAVLDLHLPDMSGLEIASLFHQRIPFLVLTMDAGADTVQQCIDLGALGYLLKPPDPEGFLRQVHIALKRGQESLNLRRALQDTQLIAKAWGLLMAYHGLPEDAAYKKLLAGSMARKRRTVELAREIIGAFDTVVRCKARAGKPTQALEAARAILAQFE